MTYKHFAYGPWSQVAQFMTWDKLQLLMDYPEQYQLFETKPELAPVEDDIQPYLLTSLLGQCMPWWSVLEFENRRTKDYAAAASVAVSAGMLPILHHEFTATSELALMVMKEHPSLKGMTLKRYNKQVGAYMFNGMYLVDAGRRVIIPKLSAFTGIQSRSLNGNWHTQADFAAWCTDSTQAAMLVVDDSPPGRSLLLEMPIVTADAAQVSLTYLLARGYTSSKNLTVKQLTRPVGAWPCSWVVDQRAEGDDKFKTAASTVMGFGKHATQTIDEVASTDEGLKYLEWLLDQTGAGDDRAIVQCIRIYLADPVIRKAAGHRV